MVAGPGLGDYGLCKTVSRNVLTESTHLARHDLQGCRRKSGVLVPSVLLLCNPQGDHPRMYHSARKRIEVSIRTEQHVKWYDGLPTRADLERRQQYADFVDKHTWDLYATLTFQYDHSPEVARARLDRFLREIEERVRSPLSCIIAPEQTYSGLGMPAGRIHFHLLLRCVKTLDIDVLELTWEQRRYGGTHVKGKSADVRPINPAMSPASYLFKQLHNPSWDWGFRHLELAGGPKPAGCHVPSKLKRKLNRDAARLHR
jgi:hypothetical protein